MFLFQYINNTMTNKLKEELKSRKKYFWDVDTKNISEIAILERLINFADIDEIKKFIKIVSYTKSKNLFQKILIKKRINIIHPAYVNYFLLYFWLKDDDLYKNIISRTKESAFFYRTVSW